MVNVEHELTQCIWSCVYLLGQWNSVYCYHCALGCTQICKNCV